MLNEKILFLYPIEANTIRGEINDCKCKNHSESDDGEGDGKLESLGTLGHGALGQVSLAIGKSNL